MKTQTTSTSNSILTRENLKDTLLEVLVNYPTKQDLDKVIDGVEKRLRLDIKLSGEETVDKITTIITQFKDTILTTVDPLLQELETRREDRALASRQSEEFDKRLLLVEKRIGIPSEN